VNQNYKSANPKISFDYEKQLINGKIPEKSYLVKSKQKLDLKKEIDKLSNIQLKNDLNTQKLFQNTGNA
jgi:hypothetical protein